MEKQEILEKIMANPLQKRLIESRGEEFKTKLAFYCENCAERNADHMTKGIKIHSKLPEIHPDLIFPQAEALDVISNYSYLHTIQGVKGYFCDNCVEEARLKYPIKK